MAAWLTKLDNNERLTLPREVIEALGLREGSRLLVMLRGDGVVELIPFDRLYREVSEVFSRRIAGWREESHEATRILEGLLAKGQTQRGTAEAQGERGYSGRV